MSRLVVIILIAFFSIANLAPKMQGLQLLKFPTLIAHVETHYGQNWSWTNLKDFVVEHYMSSKLPEDKEHKNLPFKTTVSTPTVIAFSYVIPKIVANHIEFEDANLPCSFEQVKPIMDISQIIWTPPKQA